MRSSRSKGVIGFVGLIKSVVFFYHFFAFGPSSSLLVCD